MHHVFLFTSLKISPKYIAEIKRSFSLEETGPEAGQYFHVPSAAYDWAIKRGRNKMGKP